MKKIFKAALSLPVLMLVSCESMDIKPNSQGNSETWYSTEQELQMAANRFYTIGYWNSPYQDTEQWTDKFTYRTTNRHPDNGAPLNGNITGEDYIVYHMWEQAYKLIAQANLLLTHSGRAKANGVSEDVVNRYRAEAYFARACKYAELISYFGDVPYVDKPLTIAESEVLKRMPKDQLIPKVYDDFDHAIDSLPVSYDKLKRFTKGAAMAMKARFALYMGDWKTAAEAAEAAIAQIAEQYAMPPGASGPDVGTGRPAWEGEISVESEGNVVDSLLCYAITRSSYTGGAHGMYSTQYHIYSLADGFELSLADLFDARQLEILDRAIREKIAETYDAVSDEDLSDRGFFPEYICPTENFRITPEGIAFFYNPYEIGCYALGSVEVTFTWAELDARFAAQ